MNNPLDSLVSHTFSQTEPLLFKQATATLSTEVFVDIVREEIAQKTYTERELYRAIIAGLEQQLPTIMARSLQHLHITPVEVWTDILDEIFNNRVLISWRRKIFTDQLFVRVAGQNYQLNLNDGGPNSVLETLVFPDPPPVLSATNPWPTEENPDDSQ